MCGSNAAESTLTMPRASSKPKKKVAAKSLDADAALSLFHPVTAKWFRAVFKTPTAPQAEDGR
jgi:ATP-dependent Lhr-like helicase